MKQIPFFLAVVLALSAPLWLAASAVDATRVIPVALPLSALQFLCVPVAAALATRRAGGSAGALLRRGLDWRRIADVRWRVAAFALMPLTVLLAHGLALLAGGPRALAPTPLLALPALLLVYGFSAFCEQVGWTAVLTDALLERFGTLAAGLIAGAVWAAWHIIPFFQTHHGASWVFWQLAFTVVYRVLLTRAYVASGRSVFLTVAMHATYNAAFTMLPTFGSSYDPQWMAASTLLATALAFAGAERRAAPPAVA